MTKITDSEIQLAYLIWKLHVVLQVEVLGSIFFSSFSRLSGGGGGGVQMSALFGGELFLEWWVWPQFLRTAIGYFCTRSGFFRCCVIRSYF